MLPQLSYMNWLFLYVYFVTLFFLLLSVVYFKKL